MSEGDGKEIEVLGVSASIHGGYPGPVPATEAEEESSVISSPVCQPCTASGSRLTPPHHKRVLLGQSCAAQRTRLTTAV